ncbi:hypothetical protein LXA43DRAFT_1185432 [Ganoderma leucocontextum]|nr:hypothetical protein LXA43DRAFT_1185432 [Ganoderma leucocontextum]
MVSVAVLHIESRDSLHTLEAKLPRARAVTEVLGGSPKDGETRTALLQAVIETAATQSIPEARYRGRDGFGGLAICEAQLTHTYQRCGVLVLASNRFCAGHHEEFKGLKEKLDLCVKHASEYRDQVRWGLQYRDGRDPGVELCDFPINHEQLLDTVEMYDLFLEEEVSWRRKYARWFSYLPGDAYGRQYSELREENDRLISECLKRRGKVLALRYTLSHWRFASLLSLFGAGPSEHDVE